MNVYLRTRDTNLFEMCCDQAFLARSNVVSKQQKTNVFVRENGNCNISLVNLKSQQFLICEVKKMTSRCPEIHGKHHT